MPECQFKLPDPFVSSYLDQFKWLDVGDMAIVELSTGESVGVECIERNGRKIVRPATGKHAITIRQHASTLGVISEPSEEEIQAVLARRNPVMELADV